MANVVLPDHTRESPFTAEDRVMQFEKYWERTFGQSSAALGEVQPDGTGAALMTVVNGIVHKFTYARQPNGRFLWFLDDSEEPIELLPGGRALAKMRDLASKP